MANGSFSRRHGEFAEVRVRPEVIAGARENLRDAPRGDAEFLGYRSPGRAFEEDPGDDTPFLRWQRIDCARDNSLIVRTIHCGTRVFAALGPQQIVQRDLDTGRIEGCIHGNYLRALRALTQVAQRRLGETEFLCELGGAGCPDMPGREGIFCLPKRASGEDLVAEPWRLAPNGVDDSALDPSPGVRGKLASTGFVAPRGVVKRHLRGREEILGTQQRAGLVEVAVGDAPGDPGVAFKESSRSEVRAC